MNDGDGRSPDWAKILPRAHRRIYIRIGVVAAIMVAATALLAGASVLNRAAVMQREHHEPDLVIKAKVRGVPGEYGKFRINNNSSTNAQRFAVLVTAPTGRPHPYRFSGLVAHHPTRWRRFACPAGDRVTLTIRSRQIKEPDSESVPCQRGPIPPPPPPPPTTTIPPPTTTIPPPPPPPTTTIPPPPTTTIPPPTTTIPPPTTTIPPPTTTIPPAGPTSKGPG